MVFGVKKKIPQRTIFIGDVHGCLHELRQIMNLLQPSKKDQVIFLGDLINRGPDSAGVVEYVQERGYACILGNHEEHYLQNWKKEQYASLTKKLGPGLHSWLQKRPLYMETKKFIAVHAGLQPNTAILSGEPRILLTIRTWDGKGKDLNNPQYPPWYDFYHGKRLVFYGHWAQQGLCIRHNTIGLDSGCVYGGALSAYVLEEAQVVQVKAAKAYTVK